MAEFIHINGYFNEPWEHGVERRVDAGWHTVTTRKYGETGDAGIKLPEHWYIRYADATVTNHLSDGTDSCLFAKPEVDIKENDKLPAEEQAGQPGALCLFPPQVLKPFKSGRALLCEVVQDLELSGRYVLTVQVRPDPIAAVVDGKKVYADDRSAFIYWVRGGPGMGELIELTPTKDEAHYSTHQYEFEADGPETIGLGLFNPWGLWEGNNWFLDGWSLEKIGEFPTKDRGKPREQYERTYVLLHTNAGKEWADAVTEATWDANHYTLGSSADDSGIGDLDQRRIVAVNPRLWGAGVDGRGLLGFYEEHYLGVDARQAVVDNPSALVTLLQSTPFKDLPELQPYEDVPPPNGEPQHPPPKEITTWHRQTNVPGLDQYANGLPTEAIKLVLGSEDAVRYMQAGYESVVLRFPTAHQGQYIEAMNVKGFLSNFDDAVDRAVADVQAYKPGAVIYLETTNEEDPNNPRVIEFEIRCSNEIKRRWDPYVIAVLANIAVGNGEGKALLPLAKVAYDNKHVIGYHDYEPVDLVNAERWMVEEAMWYHLRILYHIDPVFRANKVYPLYGFTEGGPVRATAQNAVAALFSRAAAKMRGETLTGPRVKSLDPAWLEAKAMYNKNPGAASYVQRMMTDPAFSTTAPGVGPLDPGGGWRHPDALNGDLTRTINLEMTKRGMILDWNKDHGHRVRFNCQFTVGDTYVGWRFFKWWFDEMMAMQQAVLAEGV